MVRVFLIMSFTWGGIHWQLLLIGSQFAIHKASRLHLQWVMFTKSTTKSKTFDWRSLVKHQRKVVFDKPWDNVIVILFIYIYIHLLCLCMSHALCITMTMNIYLYDYEREGERFHLRKRKKEYIFNMNNHSVPIFRTWANWCMWFDTCSWSLVCIISNSMYAARAEIMCYFMSVASMGYQFGSYLFG